MTTQNLASNASIIPTKSAMNHALAKRHSSNASAKHPGFAAVQSKIAAREGISVERAGAILAASSRNASAAAHHANPRLNRVKG